MSKEMEIPELRTNQFGISVKVITGEPIEKGKIPMKDDILYFTINGDSVSIELYPQKPIIIIDKDAIKMILNKVAKIDRSRKKRINNLQYATKSDGQLVRFENETK